MSNSFFKDMRRKTSPLIRRVALPKVNVEKAAQLSDPAVMKRFQENWADLEQQLFSRYNDQLGGVGVGKQGPQAFLTGAEMTWLDFLLCCELHQITKSYKSEIPPNFNHLCNWYDKMMHFPALAYVGEELEKLLDKENLRLDKTEILANDLPAKSD